LVQAIERVTMKIQAWGKRLRNPLAWTRRK